MLHNHLFKSRYTYNTISTTMHAIYYHQDKHENKYTTTQAFYQPKHTIKHSIIQQHTRMESSTLPCGSHTNRSSVLLKDTLGLSSSLQPHMVSTYRKHLRNPPKPSYKGERPRSQPEHSPTRLGHAHSQNTLLHGST